MAKVRQLPAQIYTDCSFEHSVLPMASCCSCSMLSPTAPTAAIPGTGSLRTPVSVTLVVDTSKSMKGHKWDVTVRAVTQAIDMLCEEDLFSIVTYSATVRTVPLHTVRPKWYSTSEPCFLLMLW